MLILFSLFLWLACFSQAQMYWLPVGLNVALRDNWVLDKMTTPWSLTVNGDKGVQSQMASIQDPEGVVMSVTPHNTLSAQGKDVNAREGEGRKIVVDVGDTLVGDVNKSLPVTKILSFGGPINLLKLPIANGTKGKCKVLKAKTKTNVTVKWRARTEGFVLHDVEIKKCGSINCSSIIDVIAMPCHSTTFQGKQMYVDKPVAGYSMDVRFGLEAKDKSDQCQDGPGGWFLIRDNSVLDGRLWNGIGCDCVKKKKDLAGIGFARMGSPPCCKWAKVVDGKCMGNYKLQFHSQNLQRRWSDDQEDFDWYDDEEEWLDDWFDEETELYVDYEAQLFNR